MAKKNTPIITHTEILCLAIEAATAKIRDYDNMVEIAAGKDTATLQTAAEIRDNYMAYIIPKLQALKDLYKIETGTDYN